MEHTADTSRESVLTKSLLSQPLSGVLFHPRRRGGLSEALSLPVVLLKYPGWDSVHLDGSFCLLLDFLAYRAHLVAYTLANNQGGASEECTLGLFLQYQFCFNSLLSC